jgi:hypothetical protein
LAKNSYSKVRLSKVFLSDASKQFVLDSAGNRWQNRFLMSMGCLSAALCRCPRATRRPAKNISNDMPIISVAAASKGNEFWLTRTRRLAAI